MVERSMDIVLKVNPKPICPLLQNWLKGWLTNSVENENINQGFFLLKFIPHLLRLSSVKYVANTRSNCGTGEFLVELRGCVVGNVAATTQDDHMGSTGDAIVSCNGMANTSRAATD
ncbi:hypothetical protein HG530_003946 [Fusarium avenaceum]|nr:hypothetical protein HG530_003946 [Fusarium avenaceum]